MQRKFLKASTTLILLIILIIISWSYKFPESLYDLTKTATEQPTLAVLDHQDSAPSIVANERNEVEQHEIPDDYDFGIDDISLNLIVPDVLPINDTLVSKVSIENAKPEMNGMLIWYLDDAIMLEGWIENVTDLPDMFCEFEYSRTLAETVTVKAIFRFITEENDLHEIEAQQIVVLDNYDKTYWMELEASRVLDEVSDMYKGDFTLEWALENDYDAFDKEVFVNMKGYESETDYLLWVNRSHQRVNVFTKSDGNWELIEVFIVGTGRPGRGTKRGVTIIPSRTTEGWHFDTYRVRPVVRFWPGLNKAFHSRILHPGRDEVTNERIGFPVSDGCVRMYCEDIWYIYHNIPDGTTVVVH